MEEFAIVLPNGDVVLNKVNIKGQEQYLFYDRMEFDENGKLRRFFIEDGNTPFVALYSNTPRRPFNRFFNEIEFDRLKGANNTISSSQYPEYEFKNENFIFAEDGKIIRIRKKYIKNENTINIDDDQLCTATYNLIYNHNQHAIFKDQPNDPIPFPANFDYQNNSVCLSPNDSLFSFYKIHASRIDVLGHNIDKKILMDIAILLEKYRKTDGDFYQFLEENQLINTWNEQNISWADQAASSEFYEYDNQDFLNYRNWLEKYYLSFKYYRSKINALEDPDDKFFIAASFFSEKALRHLQAEEKLKILKVFCKKSITDWWSTAFQGGSREHIVLKIVKSIKLDQYNDFLDGLSKKSVENSTLYEILYRKINGDNKKIFVNTILKYWKDSKYSPYSTDGTYIESRMAQYNYNLNTPFTLSYRSHEFLGIYKNNFDFKFSESTGNVITYTLRDTYVDENGDYHISTKIDKFFGSYTIFQPVSLLDTSFDTTVKMPVLGSGNSPQLNTLIPIFYLKYVDDTNDWESFKSEVGIFIDVALTFSGIGNLAKLRHLRDLTRLGQICAIFGAVDIAVATIDLMFKFATNNCDNQQNEFCKRFQKYLFCLQLITGATDAVLNYALRKSAKRLQEIENLYPSNFPQEYKNIINAHAVGSLDGLSEFIALTKKNVLNKIASRADLFNSTHFTNQQMNDLIDHALDLRMNPSEIEGLIFIACRNEKPIYFNQLKEQMQNWKNIIEPRGYPYKLNSLIQFNTFKTKLQQQLEHWDIPFDDVRIQGSSLRTPLAKDIDVAIMISESQIESVRNKIVERYRKNFMHNGKLEKEKFNNAVARLDDQISKGYIKNRQFGLLEGQKESFMMELYNIRQTYPNGQPIDISIIIKERNFNTPPYIKF